MEAGTVMEENITLNALVQLMVYNQQRICGVGIVQSAVLICVKCVPKFNYALQIKLKKKRNKLKNRRKFNKKQLNHFQNFYHYLMLEKTNIERNFIKIKKNRKFKMINRNFMKEKIK